MKTTLQACRSALFYLAYIGHTAVLALAVGFIPLFAGNRAEGLILKVGRYWGEANKALLGVLVGLKSEVTGGENMPEGGCLVASKHQSDWDIFAILPHTRLPAFIAKKELLDIPFFGWAARCANTIPIDRKRRGQAIPQMIEDARAAIAKGAQIIIFPEGTRKRPLDPPDYRQGVMRLYEALGVPVVPIALDSGLYWGRNSLILWPGTARAKILTPIPPGLGAEEFMARLVSAIEGETNALIAEAARRGLGRPLPKELDERLSRLRQKGGLPS